ncbi:MAG: hypothetical protein PWR06_1421 [Thermoanaerobacteraceae bacterium]|jgi:antitoxin component of RelBE/YafQ-DinJ toxin-antitoxin module|nr:hypothetical protein [Thermoanaerobacteraceae bacterium]
MKKAKHEFITLRCDEKLKTIAKKMSKYYGLTVSQYLKMIIMKDYQTVQSVNWKNDYDDIYSRVNKFFEKNNITMEDIENEIQNVRKES